MQCTSSAQKVLQVLASLKGQEFSAIFLQDMAMTVEREAVLVFSERMEENAEREKLVVIRKFKIK